VGSPANVSTGNDKNKPADIAMPVVFIEKYFMIFLLI